ncbi:MAG: hypothetical protein IIZ80_06160 [Erysipelotrichaceae bacterium]|nr:hypothetical protein [Erysipelotrichaceae bacterium]
MSDNIWFFAFRILFVLLGTVFFKIGWQIYKNQRTDLIISYHLDKVSEENKQTYCTLFAIGLFIMGAGFLFSAIGTTFIHPVFVFTPMAFGLMIGAILLAVTVIKYNR